MTNVVSLTGDGVPVAGIPHKAVISLLEEMLDRARSGNLQGLLVVALDSDQCGFYRSAGFVGSYTVVGAMTCALDEITEFARKP